MTPSEIQTAASAAKRLWPRLATPRGWTNDEWSVFAAKCSGISVDSEQAEAALRELKGTSDKYPTVASLVKAIKGTESRKPRTAEAVEEEVVGPRARLYRMKAHLGIDLNTSDSDTVKAWWIDGLNRAVKLRGFVPSWWAKDAHRDLMELANWGSNEADEWLAEQEGQCPTEPPAPEDRTPAQRMFANLYKTGMVAEPEKWARAWGRDHNAKPTTDMNMRERVTSELAHVAAKQGVQS